MEKRPIDASYGTMLIIASNCAVGVICLAIALGVMIASGQTEGLIWLFLAVAAGVTASSLWGIVRDLRVRRQAREAQERAQEYLVEQTKQRPPC